MERQYVVRRSGHSLPVTRKLRRPSIKPSMALTASSSPTSSGARSGRNSFGTPASWAWKAWSLLDDRPYRPGRSPTWVKIKPGFSRHAADQGCILVTEEKIPRLTRRRGAEARGEVWHIWYDDVRVGTIADTSGLNFSAHWTWTCGFDTGSLDPGRRSGSEVAYAAARTRLRSRLDGIPPHTDACRLRQLAPSCRMDR